MKIGIIGLGARISTVATAFKKEGPEAKFTAFADLSAAPAGLPFIKAANKSDDINAYTAPQDMLDNEEFDMLLIGSPNYEHLDHLEMALKTNVKHIFVEKPVVTNEEDTFKLLDLLKQHNGMQRVIVGLVLRYSPLYKELMQTAQQNTLGDITSIEASELIPPHHGSFFMRDWRRHTKASGGFMLEKCIHDLDLYQNLIGERPQCVASFGGRKTFLPQNTPEQDLPKPDVEGRVYPYTPRFNGAKDAFNSDADIIDYQTAIIQFPNGACLNFHTNLNAPDEARHFKIIGTKAMAQGDFVKNFYRVDDARSYQNLINNTQAAANNIGHYGADQEMVKDLTDYIKNGTALPLSILDALEAGLTALKIDEARITNKVIDLSDTWKKFDSYGLKAQLPSNPNTNTQNHSTPKSAP